MPYPRIPITHFISRNPLFQFAWVLVCWVAICTQLPSQESRRGALLLKQTDRVLSGTITRRGEFVDVEIASQARVTIPAAQVACVAGSVEELYQFKRRAIATWRVGDHFQLTRWCLQNGLLGRAAEHYAEVARQAPGHPSVVQLSVELESRLLQDPGFRRHLGLAPVVTASSTTAAGGGGASSKVVVADGASASPDIRAHAPVVAPAFARWPNEVIGPSNLPFVPSVMFVPNPEGVRALSAARSISPGNLLDFVPRTAPADEPPRGAAGQGRGGAPTPPASNDPFDPAEFNAQTGAVGSKQ